MQVKELLEHLGNYDPETHIAIAVWTEEDVITYRRNEMDGKELTQEQAREIIDDIDRKQDCDQGISWVVVLTVEDLQSPHDGEPAVPINYLPYSPN